jgi:hypothetical protein
MMQGPPSQFMDNHASQGQPPQSQGQDQSASQPLVAGFYEWIYFAIMGFLLFMILWGLSQVIR